jgi:DNA-binding Xre family transcriptional regulator
MIEIKLKALLEQHQLSAYRLAQASSGRMSQRTVYELARGELTDMKLSTLGVLLDLLRQLTNQSIEISDLISYHSEATAVAERQAKLSQHLNAELQALLGQNSDLLPEQLDFASELLGLDELQPLQGVGPNSLDVLGEQRQGRR